MSEPRRDGTPTNHPGVRALGGGRYQLRYKGEDPKTGREIERQKTVKATSPVKAAAIRDGLIEKLESGKVETGAIKLATFAASWLLSKKKTLRPSSYERYRSAIDAHICPALGHYIVQMLAHADIVKFRDGFGDMMPRSVNSILRVLKAITKAATVQLDLPKDPAAYVQGLPEDAVYTDENPNSLTSTQLAIFLDAARRLKPLWYPLFAMLAMTGARISEVSALKWIDITWPTKQELGRIRIRRSHWKGFITESTKTKRNRTVPLPQELADILGAHKKDLAARKVEGRDQWVFPSEVGTPIMHSSARNALLALLTKIEKENVDVPGFTVHGLRRTLNDLLRQHASKEVAKSVVGHVTDQMHEHYSTHRIDEKTEAMANVLNFVRLPKPKRAS